ncbi:MAG: CoA-binding protein [Candidatus Omnitrophica bacterium]|nr:CoA-binding protein [Candidatus Omnitrophota bacterium]
MNSLVKDFLSQKKFAVVGSFRNESKVAWRILKTLKNKGYEVIPVNPRLKEVEGLTCYASIKDIPQGIDVVDIVTPPEVSQKVVRDCRDKGIKRVWLQPGAESKEVIEFCRENGINVVYNLCLMLEGE